MAAASAMARLLTRLYRAAGRSRVTRYRPLAYCPPPHHYHEDRARGFHDAAYAPARAAVRRRQLRALRACLPTCDDAGCHGIADDVGRGAAHVEEMVDRTDECDALARQVEHRERRDRTRAG